MIKIIKYDQNLHKMIKNSKKRSKIHKNFRKFQNVLKISENSKIMQIRDSIKPGKDDA